MKQRFHLFFPLFIFVGCAGHRVRETKSELKNCPKTVQVFLDPSAEDRFRVGAISIPNLLEILNLNFSSQGIDIQYDIKSLRIAKWDYTMEDLPKWEDLKELKSVLFDFLEKKYKRNSESSDIRIFITGNLFLNEGVATIGKNFWRFGTHGRGDMLIGNLKTFANLDEDRDVYISGLVTTISHEQGHLFGLRHVDKKGTLMFPYLSSKNMLVLDEYSKNRLKRILANQEKCTAP